MSDYTPPQLIVMGASAPLGAEICRLGVAYGADPIIGVTTGTVPSSDPWVQGVRWTRELGDRAHPRAHIIHAALDGDTYSEVARAALALALTQPDSRLVLISIHDGPGAPRRLLEQAREFEREAARARVEFCAPRMGGIVNEVGAHVLEGEWPMRLERAAMAALRCALEPAHGGPLDVARVRYLGDAVMWQ